MENERLKEIAERSGLFKKIKDNPPYGIIGVLESGKSVLISRDGKTMASPSIPEEFLWSEPYRRFVKELQEAKRCK